MLARILLAFVFTFSFVNCKQRNSGQDLQATAVIPPPKLIAEPYPINRLPLSLLKEDENNFFANSHQIVPPILFVQKDAQGVDYGIRYMTAQSAQKYLLPGDISVVFTPLTTKSDAGEIIQGGMRHAQIIFENARRTPDGALDYYVFPGDRDTKYCHIDSPEYMSGCAYETQHFFRVIDQGPSRIGKTPEELAVELYRKGQLFKNYDDSFKTDVFTSGCERTCQDIISGNCPQMYCSELPFTLFSIVKADKTPLFDGILIRDVLAALERLKDTQMFPSLNSFESARKGLTEYIANHGASTLSDPVKQQLNQVINLLLKKVYKIGTPAENMAADLQASIFEKMAGKKVPPSAFMKEALKPNRVIVYLGSIDTSKIDPAEGFIGPPAPSPTPAPGDEE